MKSSFLTIKKVINPIKKTIREIGRHGGRAYLVGGGVRDFILKRIVTDIDIEIHKMTAIKLEAVLRKTGPVSLVGKQFGVYKIHGIDADWSLPRKDSKGRHPKVQIDPEMGIKEACRRRDVTMNSMAIDLSKLCDDASDTPQIIDPFGGLNDLNQKILRATDKNLFSDDPLRFYRVMQFVSRFEMVTDKGLDDLCKKMPLGPENVAQERVTEEIKKLLLKAPKPSLGFRWVAQIGRLESTFSELKNAANTTQRPDFHPEGDVFEHTMQTLDATARFKVLKTHKAHLFLKTETEKLTLMLAALCHDLGKITTTDKKLHAYGHAVKGLKLVKNFLARFSFNKKITSGVLAMVEFHHHPRLLAKSKPIKYKQLAVKLAPNANLRILTLLAVADGQGRNAESPAPLSEVNAECLEFARRAEKLGVLEDPESPVLTGQHLEVAIKPGPQMGVLLKEAYKIQIGENIRDPQKLMERVLKLAPKEIKF